MKCKTFGVCMSKCMLMIVMIFFCGMQINVSAQNQNVTLKATNTPINEIFKRIKNQTNLSVIFNVEDINPEKQVTVNEENRPLSEVLNNLLKDAGQELSYVIKDNYIVITKRTNVQPTTSSSQKRTITGTVVDEKNEPLIGVNVIVTGTALGTATDANGKFSLPVEKDSKLTFSYIGYITQTLTISGANNVKVVLKEDGELLDEVVVTALGIKRSEKALSYNVQQVQQEALTTIKDANFVNSLNGKIAGVNIQRGASGVGGATKVVMRGSKSISGSNNVLYVVDGMPIGNKTDAASGGAYEAAGNGGGEGISDFNPEDIESISVLTGPSAAALYGAAAANGVILINTKKGAEGTLKLNLSTSVEMMKPFIKPRFQNTYGHLKGEEVSWGPKLNTPTSFDPMEFFNTGINFTTALNASMGTRKNQSFISIASTDSKGILPSNGYYRYNFTARNTANFLNDKMHTDVSANYIIQGHQNMFSQGGYGNPLLPLYLFPRGDNFEDVKVFERYNPLRNISEQYWPYGGKISNFTSENPYWIVNRELHTSKRNRYMLFGSLTYDITPWMNVAGRVRVDNTYTTSEKKMYASTTQTLSPGTKGSFSRYQEEFKQTYADLMVNINKNFGKYYQDGSSLDLFQLNANIGTSYEDYLTEGIGIGGRLNLIPNLFSSPNLVQNQQGSGQTLKHTRNVALFASTEIGYKNYAYLTLTGRNDWPSQLVNSSESSIFYPSVGLSGVVSQMFRLPKFIDFLKIRTSYTEVGSPINFTGVTPGTITYPIEGGNLKPISIYPYPDFKAERTKSWELGLNSKFWKNRFNIDFTLYHSNTYNQTFLAPLPESSGYTGFYVQAGNVRNRGVELGLGYNDTYFRNSNNELAFSSNVTFTRNVNKILDLVDEYKNPVTGENFKLEKISDDIRKNGSMGDLTVKGILARDENGKLMLNNDGSRYEVDRSQLILIGNSDPDFSIGWRNDFNWRKINVGFLITGRFGGVVQSNTQSFLNTYGVSEQSASARDNGGVLVNGELYDARKYYESIDGLMAYYTYDATNVRLQEASLGYTIDGKYLGNVVSNITLSLTGRNLLMFYNKAPYDPEVSANTKSFKYTSEFFMMPSVRTLGFSLKVKL